MNEEFETEVIVEEDAVTEAEVEETEETEQERIDAAVAARVARQQKQHDVALATAVADARAEEQRLAQLSQEDREKELQKQYADSLKEKEDKLAVRENTADAKNLFASAGLQLTEELQSIVVTTDAEQTEVNATAVIAEITKQADALYERKAKTSMASTQPKKSGVATKTDAFDDALDELWKL